MLRLFFLFKITYLLDFLKAIGLEVDNVRETGFQLERLREGVFDLLPLEKRTMKFRKREGEAFVLLTILLKSDEIAVLKI